MSPPSHLIYCLFRAIMSLPAGVLYLYALQN
jgi:hypothetical protein